MQFCLYIPVGNITPGEFQSQAAIREMALALENAGIDACCVTDHPAPASDWLQGASGHDALDPFTALAFVAAESTRLLLQTNILVLPYRNPFITAKAATSLQLLSGGRLVLGIGAGYQKAEFEALGVDFHQRGRLTDDALDTIREIWRGEPVTRQGINYSAHGNQPRPAPCPAPKIWIGGSSEKALQRAVLRGDGWCPFFAISHHSAINQNTGVQSVDDLSQKITRIRQQRQQLNRSEHFEVNIAISSNNLFADYSLPEADRFIEDLQALEQAGADWVTVKLAHPSRAAYIEHVQWFGENIVQRLR